jgi:hypothetical protein
MIEVELIFMSTARYILHIPEEMTYDMPQISQITEFVEWYMRNWKDQVTGFQKRMLSINQKKNNFEMNYTIMEKFIYVVNLTGTD